MIEQDTVRLLRECDAGVKMGVNSINEVLDSVHAEPLRRRLLQCRDEHKTLDSDLQSQLNRYRDEGKDPNPLVQKMSWVKTNMKLAMEDSDRTIAELITDGCNMGVKSLSRYLNAYEAADEHSKDIAKKLIQAPEIKDKWMKMHLG